MTDTIPHRFTRRFVIGAAAVGITLGAAGLASATQAVLTSDDRPTPSAVSVPATNTSVDDNVTTTNSIDDTTDSSTSVEDTADDHATTNSIDDHGDDNSSSSSTPRSLPEPFTTTSTSAGGSITVSWTGTALTLDSVDPADGSSPEIKDQQWDRVRVEFKGSTESRIEVRLNDEHGTLSVRIG